MSELELTLEERVQAELLREAVKDGFHGEEALRYAEHMSGTFHADALRAGLVSDDIRRALAERFGRWRPLRLPRRRRHSANDD